MVNKKTLRTCEKGHRYEKSSACATCPICEQEHKPQEGFLSLLAAPARRALESQGIRTIEQLAAYQEAEILAWHGLGPSSIPKLRKALAEKGLSFKSPPAAPKSGNMPMNAHQKPEEFVQYHKDGSLWAKGQVIDEVPTGYWEWFRKDGTIMRSGYFREGVQVGQWTTYDKTGAVYKVTEMKDSKKNRQKTRIDRDER